GPAVPYAPQIRRLSSPPGGTYCDSERLSPPGSGMLTECRQPLAPAPPDANARPSGLKATASTRERWPARRSGSNSPLAAQVGSLASFQPEGGRRPSALQARASAPPGPAEESAYVRSRRPAAASQTLRAPSAEEEATSFPPGPKATPVTLSACPRSVA